MKLNGRTVSLCDDKGACLEIFEEEGSKFFRVLINKEGYGVSIYFRANIEIQRALSNLMSVIEDNSQEGVE